MKKLFLTFLLGMFVCGLYAQDKEIKLKIQIKDYPKESLTLGYIKNGTEFVRNAVKIENGYGEVLLKVPYLQSINIISMDDNNRIPTEKGIIPGPGINFLAEGEDVTLVIDNQQWPVVKIVGGGKINQDQNRLYEQVNGLKHKEFSLLKQAMELEKQHGKEYPQAVSLRKEREAVMQQTGEAEQQFVLDNPDSYVSLNLLRGQRMSMDIATYEKRFKNLSAELQNSNPGKEIAAYIATTHGTANGQPAPAFEKKDKDGKIVKLSDYKGKYLLLDFWGTWCGPCRSSHPHLVELYHKYNKLGLEFLNVAQENGKDAREKWLQAIGEDKLTWTQILNNEGIKECDVVKLFGVTAFPTKILIDRDGKIIKRFVGSGPDADAKIGAALQEILGS